MNSIPSHELRWKSYEVHDIVMECSRLSLDPLESSCEDDMFSFREAPPSSCSSSLGPPPPSSPLPQLGLGSGEAKMSPDVSTNVPHLDVPVRILLLFTRVPIVVVAIDDAILNTGNVTHE